jgi:hypothetical protein
MSELGSARCLPPTFCPVGTGCRMFNTYGRTPFAFMTFGRCAPAQDMGLYPRSRVFYQQSAIPHVIMRV